MTDLDARKQIFQRDGFVTIEQFATGPDFDELTNEVARYIRDVVPTLSEADAFYQDRERPETLKQLQQMERDPFFDAYRSNPQWIKLAQHFLGEEVVALGPEWFNKPPATPHATPPHQDNYYFNLKPANVLTIWMALEKTDEENGCLRYLPGSHTDGVRPHQPTQTLGFSQGVSDYTSQEAAREVPVEMEPGDVVIHHGNAVHSAHANRSTTRHRPAFAMVLKGVSCRRDEEGFARYMAAAQAQRKAMNR